jgi:adenylate cyclase
MVEAQTSRRLAAILAADVVGYSRMMAADEPGTLAALKHHRESLFDPNVARFHGRVVKLMGDGTLAEFGSIVDAVNCALAVQRAAMPEITLRIGINLGDVIIDGEDIYGDGVNIAARLEPLADPGGICISSIVNESIGGRVDAVFSDAGEVPVKNIARPIRVWKWRVSADTGRPVMSAPASAPSPEVSSIAILPFTNMSGDPEQEYFSDGITEDIITDLSKVQGLMVVARNSTFAYKGKNVDIPTLAAALRVRSVLEGSIRRAGNRVRVTAQLIDGGTGGHIWADRYDRDLTDIFAVQDELTREIVTALKIQLDPHGLPSASDTGTSNPEAQDAYFRGRAMLSGAIVNREVFLSGSQLLRQALELDPDFVRPYAWLAVAYVNDYLNEWSDDHNASLAEAHRLADIAVTRAPREVHGHAALSLVYQVERKVDEARAELERARALNPNDALVMSMHAVNLLGQNRAEEAIAGMEAAMRLDPAWAHGYLHYLGTAYLLAGKYETAAALFRERMLIVPTTDNSRAYLAIALSFQGRVEEARAVWEETLRINPRFNFESHVTRLPLSPEYMAKLREGLAKAGISP